MSNRVRVQKHPHGMFSVSIPRVLAQALQVQKGETFKWRLEHGSWS